MTTTNAVIEELHRIRSELLEEVRGDLADAIKRAHQIARQHGLPTIRGQPRRPISWQAKPSATGTTGNEPR